MATPPAYDAEDFLRVMQLLLPRGPAWPRDADAVLTAVLRGLALTYERLHARENDVLRVTFPATATEMLPEWEATLGLPKRYQSAPANVAERQQRVVSALTDTGGQSEAYFVGLAASIGIPIYIDTVSPMHVDDPVDTPLFGAGANFYWKVVAPADCDHVALEAAIRQYAPAHTSVSFSYL